MAELLTQKINETDMTQFSTAELEADLTASITDIKVCKEALALGITRYSGGTVGRRLSVNIEIQKMIEKELARRKK